MNLHDPQIQGDVLYMEDLIGLRQERHEADKVRTADLEPSDLWSPKSIV